MKGVRPLALRRQGRLGTRRADVRCEAADRTLHFPPEAHAVIAEGIKRLTDYQDEPYAQRYLGARASLRRPAGRRRRLHPRARPPPRRAHERGGRDPRGATQAARGRVWRVSRRRPGRARATSSTSRNTSSRAPRRSSACCRRGLGAGRSLACGPTAAWPLKVTTTRPVGLPAPQGCWRRSSAGGRARCALPRRRRGWSVGSASSSARLPSDPAAAREVVASAALVRGYGDTYKRGLANWCTDHGRRRRADAGGPAAARAFRRRRAAGEVGRQQGPRGRGARGTPSPPSIAHVPPGQAAAE